MVGGGPRGCPWPGQQVPPGSLEPELQAPNLSHQEHKLPSRSLPGRLGLGVCWPGSCSPPCWCPGGGLAQAGATLGRSPRSLASPARAEGPQPTHPSPPLSSGQAPSSGRIPAQLQRLPAPSSAPFLLCFPGEAPASVHRETAQQPWSRGRQGAGRAPDMTLSSWSQTLGAKAGGRRGGALAA